MFGGMPLFDSLLHSFGTAGTGGFGVYADSIASYSPYLQWVITVFMFIFGIYVENKQTIGIEIVMEMIHSLPKVNNYLIRSGIL